MKNKHIGSKFDDFLKDENLYVEAQATAIKRVIAYQIKKAMDAKQISKKAMSERMGTKSRAHLDRLLDPKNSSVTLLTLEKAAKALGKRLEVHLI